MRIDFDVYGEDKVSYDLLRFAGRAANVMPVLEVIAEGEREKAESRFDRQGPGWAPLAASTLEQKSRQGLDPRILRATGALMDSLTSLGGSHIEIVTPDSLLMASRDPKAHFHQDGTSRMPQRKVVDVTAQDRLAHIKAIQRYIVEGDLTGGVWSLV